MSLNRSRQSRNFTERRQKRTVIGLSAGLIALATWIFILSRLSFVSGLAITDVSVYAEPDLVPSLQAAASSSLDGSYMGLFSRSNTIIYPKSDIIAAISSTSPRIDDIKVSRSGLHGLTISVSEKTPASIVCADLPDLTDTNAPLGHNCYLADEKAFLFRKATDADAKQDRMRFYIPALPDTDITGTYATSTDRFDIFVALVSGLKNAGINIHSMLVKDDNSYEIYADNPDGKSIVVIDMNDSAGLDLEKENLIVYWNKMVGDASAQGKTVGWNEIKLQFPPNIYTR